MRKLTRDVMATAGLAAAVLVSLMIVRGTASEPAPAPSPTTTVAALPSWPTLTASAPTPTSPVVSPPAASSGSTAQPAPRRPLATLVLSSGAPVNPRLDRTPRTARPASTASLTVALTAPPDNANPQVYRDPAAVAEAWLAALCWYDYRTVRDDNIRRAAAYGDIGMPPGQDPWTFQARAWAQITATRTSSACTNITATVETSSPNSIGQTMVTLTATQVLSAAGTSYQSVPIDLTRIVERDPAGHWGIGRPVTAN